MDPAARWRAIVDKVKAASSRHGASLAHGRLLRLSPGEVVLGYPKDASFHRSTVAGQSGKVLVEKVISEYLCAPTRLVIEEAADQLASAAPSVAEEEARTRADHERDAEAGIRAHPAVLATLRILGGALEHVQVLEKEARPVEALDGSDEGA